MDSVGEGEGGKIWENGIETRPGPLDFKQYSLQNNSLIG